MLRYVTAMRLSLRTGNSYSALFLALTLPDICGRLEDPEKDSRERYEDWFRTYMAGIYPSSFLTPEDCYALRCAALHEGAGDISNQRSKKILDEVCFLSPDSHGLHGFVPGHCNRLTNVAIGSREFGEALFLHVNNFCEDMCKGVEKWLVDVARNQDIKTRMKDLLTIC